MKGENASKAASDVTSLIEQARGDNVREETEAIIGNAITEATAKLQRQLDAAVEALQFASRLLNMRGEAFVAVENALATIAAIAKE